MTHRIRKTLPPASGHKVNILDMLIQTKQPTPKRNDPCPCGSGRKFKVCCKDKEDK